MHIKKIIGLTIVAIAMMGNVSVLACNSDGMIRVKSINDVTTTLNKLENILNAKGMTIFKRVSHSEGAKKVNLTIRDTELLIFGNPKIGTKLMQCNQSAALDLPLKALSYEDKNGQVWLAYNDPAYIAKRHHIKQCSKVINKMTKALANFAKAATN